MKQFNRLILLLCGYLAAATLPENLSGVMRGEFYQRGDQLRVSEGCFWLSRQQQSLRWDLGEDSWYFSQGRLRVWQRPLAQIVSYEGLPAQAESLSVLLGSEEDWRQQYSITRSGQHIDMRSWNGRTQVRLTFDNQEKLSQLHWQMADERLQLQFTQLSEQAVRPEDLTLPTQGLDTISLGSNHD